MKNGFIYYSVGALLYCPGNKQNIADHIVEEKFGKQFSLALCLEDSINENFVEDAKRQCIQSLKKIYKFSLEKDFYLPKIFIRVRNPEQIEDIFNSLGDSEKILCGFIVPKFSIENSHDYIEEIYKINQNSSSKKYVMPIYENSSIIDLRKRFDILYELKDGLSKIQDLVLNIRVGGNDLCHAFGFRRNSFQSIHQIKTISNIFSDIITVYGMDYVVSGPVWEYYGGENWDRGLIAEIEDDKLCGFCGKTVIHPKQIPIVNEGYKVQKKDFDDAKAILNWDKEKDNFVLASTDKERMNEYKTHTNWAEKIIYLSQVFGVKE